MMHRGRPVFHALPTAGSILTLLAGIEKRAPLDPALASLRKALTRQGREAHATGGLAALDALMDAVAAADPDRAGARIATLRAAWADLLPESGEA